MPDKDKNRTEVPSWFLKAGFATGALILVFFMVLVLVSILGFEVGPDSRFHVIVVLSLGIGLSATFLGGHALAEGKIPLPFALTNPVSFSVGGGLATIVIFMVLGSFLYPSAQKLGDLQNLEDFQEEFGISHSEEAQQQVENVLAEVDSLPLEKAWVILQSPPSELDEFTNSAVQARLGGTQLSEAEDILGGPENEANAKAILKMILVLMSDRSQENLARWQATIISEQ